MSIAYGIYKLQYRGVSFNLTSHAVSTWVLQNKNQKAKEKENS